MEENTMSQEQSVNEVKYKMAFGFLKKLLDQGKISHEEYETADRYIAEKYKPLLAAI
jgi:hypothetical protein